MLNRKFKTMFHFPLIFTLFSACGPSEPKEEVTESEKERRQDLTFDLAGSYHESAASSAMASTISIYDERLYHDIKVFFNLGRSLSDFEKTRVSMAFERAEPRMTKDEITTIIQKLEDSLKDITLGEGKTYAERGGENIVLDAKGNESEVVVKSVDQKFHTSTFTNSVESYYVRANLYLTANKQSRSLEYQVTRNTDNIGMTTDKTKGLRLNLKRRTESTAGTANETVICDLDIALGKFLQK